KSFNDSANAGLTAAHDKFGITGRTVDSKSESDYKTNLEALAEGGATLVIGVGFAMLDSVKAASVKYPKVNFAIVDAVVDAPNVRSLVFKEEEGSYLAGYLAGETSKTGKIGFVGGMDTDLIKKFQYGYQAGALAANPKIQILPSKYVGDWVNVAVGKEMAKGMFDGGADIVYAAAGRAGLGVISAAKETGKYAIGVDSDQDDLEKGAVLTSMIKRVDTAVLDTIGSVVDKSFEGGTKVYDLKANGLALSDMRNTKDAIGADKIKALDAVKADIISGKVIVPATEAQYKDFVAARNAAPKAEAPTEKAVAPSKG
ncbi:MAG: BMP family ABC transporter substrate-binding protein, partial [Armatimonadota bacterium]